MPISHTQEAENEKFDADPNAGIADEGDQTEQTAEDVTNLPIGPGNETPQSVVPSVGLGLNF